MGKQVHQQVFVSQTLLTTKILFWTGCFLSLVTVLSAVAVIVLGSWPDGFGLTVMAMIAILLSWAATRFAQVELKIPEIEVRTLFSHTVLPKEDFLRVELAWFGFMRARFANGRSALFLPNYLFYQDLFSTPFQASASPEFLKSFNSFLTDVELQPDQKARFIDQKIRLMLDMAVEQY